MHVQCYVFEHFTATDKVLEGDFFEVSRDKSLIQLNGNDAIITVKVSLLTIMLLNHAGY